MEKSVELYESRVSDGSLSGRERGRGGGGGVKGRVRPPDVNDRLTTTRVTRFTLNSSGNVPTVMVKLDTPRSSRRESFRWNTIDRNLDVSSYDGRVHRGIK